MKKKDKQKSMTRSGLAQYPVTLKGTIMSFILRVHYKALHYKPLIIFSKDILEVPTWMSLHKHVGDAIESHLFLY